MLKRFLLLGLFVFLTANIDLFAGSMRLPSPDGRTWVEVEDTNGELYYSVRFDGKVVIAKSLLGLKFKGIDEVKTYRSVSYSTSGSDSTWEYKLGRQRVYRDFYKSGFVRLQESPRGGRTFGVEFRVYNDGVAFRYLIGQNTVGGSEYTLERDLTQFNFPNDPVAWFADFGSFHSSQEKPYPKGRLSSIGKGDHVGCPVVVQTSETGPYVALTESELNHWGGLYFEGQEDPNTKILFDSEAMKAGDKAKTFNITLENVDTLELISDNAGDGNTSDHADWCDIVLTDNDGNKVNLSTLKFVTTRQDWGELHINKSVGSKTLTIGGTEYKTGFGTHATGSITFNLDNKYKSLEGAAGVDDEENGKGTVRFKITSRQKQSEAKLQASLSPRLDGNGLAVAKTSEPTPWRVIIVAPKAINLVDQTIIMNLSRPTVKGDWSWIKPGIGTWDWWSDNNSNMSTDSIKPFIDFASEMGWQYHFVDDPWYAGKKYKMGDPRNNVLKGSDTVDIEELARYAKEKNVRLFLWLNWKDIERQMDEAFAQYEKWGIAGVKIDFMDRDDQEIVEWYDKTVKKAAAHKLMVDFHGAYKPTGYNRTYPNLITREGVYGNEQNKWTRLTADHYCTLPYTRYMLGAGDFTPGAFLNRNIPGDKRIEGYNTAQGIGTRAHELAISFLYDSPILCLCDRPEIYRGQAGLDYYRNLPTVWDESRGVEGEIGEYFSLIRRSGNDWYYAAITDDKDRELTLPLSFLDKGNYEATIYADTEETRTDGRKIAIETKQVTSSDVLKVKMISGGGQAIVFRKK